MDLVIFDLDGTLALNKHREHLALAKRWDEYFELCYRDTPNTYVIQLARLIHYQSLHKVVEIWSGRSEVVRDMTEKWLRKCHVPDVPLKMRPVGDRRPDVELKEKWLDECDHRVVMTFDDRDSVVAMWRRRGIVCCQVAPGDF